MRWDGHHDRTAASLRPAPVPQPRRAVLAGGPARPDGADGPPRLHGPAFAGIAADARAVRPRLPRGRRRRRAVRAGRLGGAAGGAGHAAGLPAAGRPRHHPVRNPGRSQPAARDLPDHPLPRQPGAAAVGAGPSERHGGRAAGRAVRHHGGHRPVRHRQERHGSAPWRRWAGLPRRDLDHPLPGAARRAMGGAGRVRLAAAGRRACRLRRHAGGASLAVRRQPPLLDELSGTPAARAC
ncbi:hypothetical protein SAMN02982994_3638 [Azospirillum lipoferum]|nr:hypothetical protein SAMN02982994_3638 [Azospirillum lipoferum]